MRRFLASNGMLFVALVNIGIADTAVANTKPDALATAAPSTGKDTKAKAPPSKEVLQQYMKALSQGREADKKGLLDQARKQFESAVALLPEGGAAQSELGWVAYRQKDLPTAERATRAAIACSSQSSLRSASLYNLGQILTAQGKKPEAVRALQQAWELGHNAAALSALRALDPAVAAAAGPTIHPLDSSPIQGNTPEALRLAACRVQLWSVVSKQDPSEQMMTREEIDDWDAQKLHCEEKSSAFPSDGGQQKAMVVSTAVSLNHYGLSTIGVWVKTTQGWFYRVLHSATDWKWNGATASLKEVRVVGKFLEIRTGIAIRDETQTAHYSKHGFQTGASPPEEVGETNQFAHFAGMGASGRPSVTSPIEFGLSRVITSHNAAERSAEKTYPIQLGADGTLLVGTPAIKRKQMSERDFSGSELMTPSGSFPLKFP